MIRTEGWQAGRKMKNLWIALAMWCWGSTQTKKWVQLVDSQ